MHRIYIAGPYSAPTEPERLKNVARAEALAREVMARGHLAHCPHAATRGWEQDNRIGYERIMDLDLSIIRMWATAILYAGSSPGADRELEAAMELGLAVFRGLHEVPWVV